jgi:hypothetical protein
MPKTDLIAVQPRWWNQALGQVEKLAQSADRVSKLVQTIKADQVSPEALDVLVDLLTGFSDTADSLTAELGAIQDGSSTYIVGDSSGSTPPDILSIAQGYLTGHVANGEVIEERVWDYGDGPDALPDAIESVAQRMRELPPEERTAAQVFVLMNRDAGPPGTVPSAG